MTPKFAVFYGLVSLLNYVEERIFVLLSIGVFL